jgi:trk system potassium uptake protein TrkA
MKIVILGCGRVGATLATLMVKDGHEVTIIDQNSEAFMRLGQEYKNKIKTVVGDGIDEDVLRRAGLDQADAFAAVTNGDNRNIMATQIAKLRFNVQRAICRIYDPIRVETYKSLGLESVSPTIVGAKLFRDALLRPTEDGQAPSMTAGQGHAPGRAPSVAGQTRP